MHALTSWFVRNPVAANLTMVFILVAGLISVIEMRVEGFPQIPPEKVEIRTVFPDATPDQTDRLVTARIALALDGLEGVDSVSSRSNGDQSFIAVKKTNDQDLGALVDAIRLRIDAIDDLPDRAERPVIEAAPDALTAVYVSLYGDGDRETRQRLARDLRDALIARPEISTVNSWGLLDREITIEIDPLQFQLLGLTAEEVIERIREQSVEIRTGNIPTDSGTVILRADSVAQYARDFAAIPIIERLDGRDVQLGDVATIRDGFRDREQLYHFDGAPAVTMDVDVGARDDLLEVTRVAEEVASEFGARLPQGLQIAVWGDRSRYIDDRLELLKSNGLLGLALIVLLLALFLDTRLAFWVAMGVPISILGALAVVGTSWFDFSLNDVTTYGLIVALGILVDDAVIVGESVFEARRLDPDPVTGTETGVFNVTTPTVFGVGTTIAAFLPMALIDNALGQVLAGFSGIVVLALLFSLFESKCILPAHLAQVRLRHQQEAASRGIWSRCQGFAQGGLRWVREGPFRWVLRGALSHRYAVAISCVGIAVLGAGLIAKGKIPVAFFPEVPEQVLWVQMDMDSRASSRLTAANLEELESAISELGTRLTEKYELKRPLIQSAFLFYSGARRGYLAVELSPTSARPGLSSGDVGRYWNERMAPLEGVVDIEYGGADGFAGGFSLRLLGPDGPTLRAAEAELMAAISQYAGVYGVRSGLEGGQSELSINLRPDAIGLGITPEQLARQIGTNYGGAEVQRILRDGQDIEVRLHVEDAARDEIGDILDARIRSDQGMWLRVAAVTEIEGTYTPSAIARFNGDLVSTVSAVIDSDIVTRGEIVSVIKEEVMPGILAKYPGVALAPGGALEEQENIEDKLIGAGLLSILAIYALLAIPLKSYFQPFLIFAVLPFGAIGAVLGHVLLGLPVSVFSFFGMLALAGVMVNDSLVLISRYHALRAQGAEIADSIVEASLTRFQAIFLTTATTVIGLAPLMTEISEQAQILIPAAVSIAFGLISATLITLILLPVLLMIYAQDLVEPRAGARRSVPSGA